MAAALWCVLGLAALLVGAELLIRSGTTLAALMRISPIVIGLTIVSVGTSLPELAVGIEAALIGSGGLAVGNIAGTNTFNILFILGLSAALSPLMIEKRTIRIDLPAMIAAAIAFVVMAWDGELTRAEGLILVGAAIVYTGIVIRSARSERAEILVELSKEFAAEPVEHPERYALLNFALLIASVAIIVIGADWLVDGSVELARSLGVSEAFIGLTVVAIGTSAPELVTTVVSTLRQQRDIAVGNLLGSSIYNILFILGTTATVSPRALEVGPNLVHIDIPIMAAVTIVCVPVFLSGQRVTRLEGCVFVAAYLAYFAYLLISRT